MTHAKFLALEEVGAILDLEVWEVHSLVVRGEIPAVRREEPDGTTRWYVARRHLRCPAVLGLDGRPVDTQPSDRLARTAEGGRGRDHEQRGEDPGRNSTSTRPPPPQRQPRLRPTNLQVSVDLLTEPVRSE